MVDKQDILATIGSYAVIAALIVTVTYTSVITPPKAFSGCTDLCQATTARLVLGMRAALNFCTPQAEKTGSAQVCVPLESPDYEANYIGWGNTYRPFILNYMNKVNLSASAVDEQPPFQTLFEAYIVFNAIALLSALACMAIAAMFTYSALQHWDEDVKDASVQSDRAPNANLLDTNLVHGNQKIQAVNASQLNRVRLWMKITLMLSMISVLVAFACVHYYVFWVDGLGNVGVYIVWVLAGLMFAGFIVGTVWVYRVTIGSFCFDVYTALRAPP